ncbi:hypothetical protein T12_7646 [Trichinella patagoniensis]|uniref:Uncharacterized protein n=1 Tax=Trichinella patagoniensis TaxID=990121 RepID=A0A0V0Z8F7_9BILA|nr:hypothetical protein T12_7646 [Trichinella patagoniensis]
MLIVYVSVIQIRHYHCKNRPGILYASDSQIRRPVKLDRQPGRVVDCIFRSFWPTGGMVSQAGDDSRPQVRHNFLSQMSGFFNPGYARHAGGNPKATAIGAVSFGTPVYKT